MPQDLPDDVCPSDKVDSFGHNALILSLSNRIKRNGVQVRSAYLSLHSDQYKRRIGQIKMAALKTTSQTT